MFLLSVYQIFRHIHMGMNRSWVPHPQKLGGRLEIGRLTGIQHVYTCSSKIWMLSAKHNQSSQPLILNTPILWS